MNSFSTGTNNTTNLTNPQNQAPKSSVVGSLIKAQNQKEDESNLDIENKRMKYIKKLSLAQKMGIVDRPELPLGLTQWHEIENTYLLRTQKEKDNSCPICFEDLNLSQE